MSGAVSILSLCRLVALRSNRNYSPQSECGLSFGLWLSSLGNRRSDVEKEHGSVDVELFCKAKNFFALQNWNEV